LYGKYANAVGAEIKGIVVLHSKNMLVKQDGLV
jgi:hypothetical protein